MTADEFMLIDNQGFELVDGRPREKNMGMFSSVVAFWISKLLNARFDLVRYGFMVDSEGGYQCWADDPNRVRKPDLSFVRRERLPGGKPPEGWCQVAPDFAIEVLSKNDTLSETEEKVEEYLAVGVPLIWVIDPKAEQVYVYRGSLQAEILRGEAELWDDVVLPGFRCRAPELFPPTGYSE
jgi:Uma2 family endonuclease